MKECNNRGLLILLAVVVCPSKQAEDGINAYVFRLVVRLMRGKELPLRSLYLDCYMLAWTSAFKISPPWWGVMT